MQKEIKKVLKYFSFFSYPATFEEIYTFFPKKISKKKLQQILTTLIKEKKLITQDISLLSCNDRTKIVKLYTLPEYTNLFRKWTERRLFSQKKIRKIQSYVKLLSFFSQIKLVGLSGTVAMMNAADKDDIDLFIVTAKNRLWTGRFIAVVISYLLGVRRRYGDKQIRDKICLNLFFDEGNLSVPDRKKTEFVAHEILQMKPLINKGKVYERFLEANKWAYELFPNAKFVKISNFKNLYLNKNLKLKIKNFGDWVEDKLKNFQLSLIKKHRTTEIITETQLWFHPVDFGKQFHPRRGNLLPPLEWNRVL